MFEDVLDNLKGYQYVDSRDKLQFLYDAKRNVQKVEWMWGFGDSVMTNIFKQTYSQGTWIHQFTYDANENVSLYYRYDSAHTDWFEKWEVTYDNNLNPLYNMIEENISPFYLFHDNLFYHSKSNPVNVIYNSSLFTPCSNVPLEYKYVYDASHRPLSGILVDSDGSVLTKVKYEYN